MTGIDLPVLDNSAAYIAEWLRHIRNGSAADVVRAAILNWNVLINRNY